MSAPSLSTLLDLAFESRLAGLRVALPGRVTAYNKTTQRASVQVDIQDAYLDEDEQRRTESLPVLNDVPVLFQGAGGCRITFPVRVGDPVLVVFSSSSIARWKATRGGGTGGPVDPGDDRHHHLADAVAIPGLSADTPTDAPDDAMVLHAEDEIRLGGPGANDTVARQSDLEVLANAIQGAADGIGFGSALKATLETANWPNCTSKVKAE